MAYVTVGCRVERVARANARVKLAEQRRRERWLARNQPATAQNVAARVAREPLEGR